MEALRPTAQKFVLHWGEMGTRWGINRSVAQIHALLFISPKPLNAEEIATTLSLARSNVSYGLRELQNWGLIRPVPRIGDRREYYETMTDVWQMFRLVLDERKRREVDPTLAVLRECVAELQEQADPTNGHTHERLRDLLEFFESTSAVYQEVRGLPLDLLRGLAKSGPKLRRLLDSVS